MSIELNIPHTRDGEPVNGRFREIKRLISFYKYSDKELSLLKAECDIYWQRREALKQERFS